MFLGSHIRASPMAVAILVLLGRLQEAGSQERNRIDHPRRGLKARASASHSDLDGLLDYGHLFIISILRQIQ